jgi:hypothetical protein
VVQAVRQRDVDRVDLRVVEQRAVASVRALEAILGGVGAGLRVVPACDGNYVDAIRALRPVEDRSVDVRRR